MVSAGDFVTDFAEVSAVVGTFAGFAAVGVGAAGAGDGGDMATPTDTATIPIGTILTTDIHIHHRRRHIGVTTAIMIETTETMIATAIETMIGIEIATRIASRRLLDPNITNSLPIVPTIHLTRMIHLILRILPTIRGTQCRSGGLIAALCWPPEFLIGRQLLRL